VPTEPVSLDETYLELTELSDPVARMSDLVRRIRARLELDASVGIGPNKLVAKVASDAEKPRGFCVLSREQAARRFADAPVSLLPGIGPKTAERLRGYGVETIGQLQRCTVPGLIERFGDHHGRALHDRAHFRDDSPVARREAKSRSVEATFDNDIADLAELQRTLADQARRLAAGLAERDLAGRNVAIKVRLDDWTTYTRARTLDVPTADAETIGAVAASLLDANRPWRPVRLLGVRVGAFAADNVSPTTQEGDRLTLLRA
jgi:DNA polymerase-4